MVAKSYQSAEMLGEPFQKSGRMYINIRTKTGLEKTVRWYTPKEYAKMYPEDKAAAVKERKPQKDVLGFGEKGYIYLYEGNEHYLEYNTPARLAVWWGWYYPDLIPDLPQGTRVYTLDWSAVGNEDGSVNKTKVKNYKKERKQCFALDCEGKLR